MIGNVCATLSTDRFVTVRPKLTLVRSDKPASQAAKPEKSADQRPVLAIAEKFASIGVKDILIVDSTKKGAGKRVLSAPNE